MFIDWWLYTIVVKNMDSRILNQIIIAKRKNMEEQKQERKTKEGEAVRTRTASTSFNFNFYDHDYSTDALASVAPHFDMKGVNNER